MIKQLARKLFVYTLILNFLSFGFASTASAGLIGTQSAIAAQERQARVERVEAVLARDDVRQQLQAMGVDADAAQARVASMTDAEIDRVAQHIDQLPAGAGVIEVIGVVFVVLLILEILGVTDIFKKI